MAFGWKPMSSLGPRHIPQPGVGHGSCKTPLLHREKLMLGFLRGSQLCCPHSVLLQAHYLTQLPSLSFPTVNWALQSFSSLHGRHAAFTQQVLPVCAPTVCGMLLSPEDDNPLTQATSSTSQSLIWWETQMGGRLVHMSL